jgi:hypothetical protein
MGPVFTVATVSQQALCSFSGVLCKERETHYADRQTDGHIFIKFGMADFH